MVGNNRHGFTLIEAEVALAITGLVVVAATSVFLLGLRASRSARAQDRLAAAASLVTERIIRDARTGGVNYGGYPGGSAKSPTTTLELIRKDGDPVTYTLSSDPALCGSGDIPCLAYVAKDGSGRLIPDDMAVSSLLFYLQPTSDPFIGIGGDFSGTETPMVTVVLLLTDTRDSARPSYHIQTSVTTRDYYDSL